MKFKRRKAATLKKLDEEQQNLVRVNGHSVRADETAEPAGKAGGEGKNLSEEEAGSVAV